MLKTMIYTNSRRFPSYHERMMGGVPYFKNFSFYDEVIAEDAKSKYPDISSDISPNMINSLNDGDHNAFRYIYLHYYDALTDFLSSLLQSRDDAKDISQEVFANLWMKRGIFDPEKGIKRYLYHIAKLLALNYFDKLKVRNKYKEFQSRTNIYDLAADDIIQGDEAALLAEIVISRMPPRQREVFLLSREQNLSYEEIAQQLGISKNKVRNYISVSLGELRKVLTMFVLLF